MKLGTEEVTVDERFVNKKLKRIRLNIDKEIDLYINAEAYKDKSKFDIQRNGDGSINMIIKNVINYIEKQGCRVSKDEMLKELDLSIAVRDKDIEYISKLNSTGDKVKYLRIIKGYKQIDVAEMIGISTRQVQRIEKNLKKI